MPPPSSPAPSLGPRALNRATLARQLLLTRSPLPTLTAIQQLVGLHGQIPAGAYVGLWSRLQRFAFAELGALITDRRVVRTALLRSTIHLVSAEDCLGLRAAVQPVLDRDLYTNASHSKALRGLNVADVLAAGRDLLDQQPRTASELGTLLQRQWPDHTPQTLAYVVRNLATLVHVPPRGVWGATGQSRHTTVETWLGRSPNPVSSLETMILRYLTAFGPATIQDMQTWCGLTRLAEVTERLRPNLLTIHNEHGRELFDLPNAPRPDPDHPAPPRLLPEFDNVFLSYADRSRIIPDGLTFAQFTRKWGLRNQQPGGLRGTLLLDGFVQGAWAIIAEPQTATLRIRPFRSPSRQETAALTAEGSRLLAATNPAAAVQDVQVIPTAE